jgi:hypothetical protein
VLVVSGIGADAEAPRSACRQPSAKGLKLDADWVVLFACDKGAGAGTAAEAHPALDAPFSMLERARCSSPTSARELVTDLRGPARVKHPARLQIRTCLCRQSNRSLSARRIPAGKEFGEARDRNGIFGDTGRFRATETALSRVAGGKAAEC